MSLIKCPKCGKEFSSLAKACPKCGYINKPVEKEVILKDKESIWSKTWVCIIALIVFYPVGLFLMWKYKKLHKIPRIIITAFFIMAMLNVFSDESAEEKVKENPKEVAKEEIAPKEERKETKEETKGEKQEEEKQEIPQETKEDDAQEKEVDEKSNILLPDKYVENFKTACNSCGMDINNVSNFEQVDDWANGERYSFLYNGERFLVYLIDNGEISSINDMSRNKIYEKSASEKKKKNKKKSKTEILLTDGDLGEYGKEEDFSGYKSIRYYIPTGKYIVGCQTRGSGFYIETIEKHLENGYETSDVIAEVKFSSADEKYKVEIKDGECISLIINSIIEFEKIE